MSKALTNPPTRITKKWFVKVVNELKLSEFQITAARILLQVNGKDSMIKYLQEITNIEKGQRQPPDQPKPA